MLTLHPTVFDQIDVINRPRLLAQHMVRSIHFHFSRAAESFEFHKLKLLPNFLLHSADQEIESARAVRLINGLCKSRQISQERNCDSGDLKNLSLRHVRRYGDGRLALGIREQGHSPE